MADQLFLTSTYSFNEDIFLYIVFNSSFFKFYDILTTFLSLIRVITKLPNSEQSYKGKVKTHSDINRQNQSTTGKLWKLQWPWLGTGISKEMVGWIRFYGAKPPFSLRFKGSGCHYNSIYNNTETKQVKQLSNQRQTQWSKCQKHFYVTHW